ncbi:cytochrome P450 2C5-like isoform X1 [Candoia aspera]|uniref:cytochrome P450 2C5-like isoform X1 n=1 Tax=Candoia aspera TaxID=51853 RepID=UPI002FD8135B
MVLVGAVVLILLGVLCSIVFASFQMYKKKGELPPGPTPWPILGNLFQKNILPLYKSYSKLAKKYGPVFTVWMGPKPLVVLCGYEVVKDALVHHAEEFGGRPDIPFDVRVTKGQGILSKNETKWRELRRFTLSTLRNFGMGKTAMSKRVQEEALCLGEEIATTQGQPFNPKGIIMNATSNVICSVIFGNRFEYGNQTFLKQLYILANEVGYFHSFLGLIYNTFPKIMDYFPGKHTKIFADSEKVCDFIREKVEFHRRTLDPQNPRDYIDCFLIRSEKNSSEDFYSIEDLVMSVYVLFFAGTTTTSQTLLYSLLAMAKFPDIQAKVQQEINEVVGANRSPTTEDRLRMPFTNAVVHEIQRYQKGSLENFPRATTCDTKFHGYNIPKNTAVVPMLSSVHFDPLQWETPERFNPDHFLDEKGQFRKRDAFMPFSAGKRACPGEALARMELFLFFSTLLQKFTFHMAGDSKDTDIWSLFMDFRNKNQFPLIRAIRCSETLLFNN